MRGKARTFIGSAMIFLAVLFEVAQSFEFILTHVPAWVNHLVSPSVRLVLIVLGFCLILATKKTEGDTTGKKQSPERAAPVRRRDPSLETGIIVSANPVIDGSHTVEIHNYSTGPFDQHTADPAPARTSNIQMVNHRIVRIRQLDDDDRFVEHPSGDEAMILDFRNESIPAVQVQSFRRSRAHIRFFNDQHKELASIDSAYWWGSDTDQVTLEVGYTHGVILAVFGDAETMAINLRKRPKHPMWPPIIDEVEIEYVTIPKGSTSAEIILIDDQGVSTPTFVQKMVF